MKKMMHEKLTLSNSVSNTNSASLLSNKINNNSINNSINTNINLNYNPIIHQRAKSSYKMKKKRHHKEKYQLNIVDMISQISKTNLYSNIANNIHQTNNNNTNNIIITTNTNVTSQNLTNLYKEYKSFSPNPRSYFNCKNYLPPKTSNNKKTLVIDLDETLVHSSFIPFDCQPDITINIEIENELHNIYILVRPYVKHFLEKMSEKFELVVFTAGISPYANKLLNIIDEQGLISFRLFREHCTLINTTFVKDLNRLGRELKDVIILDNSPIVYALNKDNGFPISSWFFDKNDTELLKIIPILEFLSYVPDVRTYTKKLIKDNQIQFQLVSGIIASYNNKLKNSQLPFNFIFDNLDNINFNNGCSGKINKSSSLKENLIKNFYIENTKKPSKINKKKLNITGVDFINKIKSKNISITNYKKNLNSIAINQNFNYNACSLNKENNNINSIQPTDINRLNSISFNYENLNRMNTMRANSSTKKIIYLASKDKKSSKNVLKAKLKNFLYYTNNKDGLKTNHRKSTLSMSQRVGKNNLV